jgi:hypothetical protein
MHRAQARMVQGPEASGLTVMLRSDFYESRVPLQVRPRLCRRPQPIPFATPSLSIATLV